MSDTDKPSNQDASISSDDDSEGGVRLDGTTSAPQQQPEKALHPNQSYPNELKSLAKDLYRIINTLANAHHPSLTSKSAKKQIADLEAMGDIYHIEATRLESLPSLLRCGYFVFAAKTAFDKASALAIDVACSSQAERKSIDMEVFCRRDWEVEMGFGMCGEEWKVLEGGYGGMRGGDGDGE